MSPDQQPTMEPMHVSKGIALMGAGTVVSLLSLMLSEKGVAHTYHIPDPGFDAMALPPLSNQLVNRNTRETESRFLSAEVRKALLPLKKYASLSYLDDFTRYHSIEGEYEVPTYALDNRLRMRDFFDQIRASRYAEPVKLEAGEIPLPAPLTVFGGGERFSQAFSDMPGLSTAGHHKKRDLFFLNLEAPPAVLHKYTGVYIHFLSGIGEILLYPFLHAWGHIGLNLTVNIIKDGPWDSFTGLSDTREALEALVALLIPGIPGLARDLETCRPTEDRFSILANRAYFKKPVRHMPDGKILLGVGEAVIKSDPITGLGYNVGVDMVSMLAGAIAARTDGAALADAYGNHAERLETYLYHIHTSQTQGSANAYLPEIYRIASGNEALKRFLFSAYDDISLYFPWLLDETAAQDLIKKYKPD